MRNVYFKAVSVLLFFAVIMSVFATGCEFPFKDGTPDTDKAQNMGETQPKSLESGFYAYYDCVGSTAFHCAYKSDKTEFDIDNVTLDFYYGVEYLFTEEDERETIDIPSFDLYLSNGKSPKISIKHVEENLISEKYRCHIAWDEDSKITYNHCETVTIPRELFVEESECLYFSVYGTNVREFYPEYRSVIGAHLHYKIVGERVILAAMPFNSNTH